MTDSLPQRVAFITGASRGIGRATAIRLAAAGRHVVLASRSTGPLEELQSQIDAAGHAASVCPVDVGDADALAAAIEATVKQHGRFDILVNNAGITRDNLLLRMSNEEFDEVVNVNLRSAFVACRAAARPMMKGKFGRIVNIASTSGLVGNAGQANYAAAKAGMVGLSRTIARELGSKGITANVVAPGFVETDMTKDLPTPVRDGALATIPAKRFGQPEDIAAAIDYVTSDDAGFITGQVLTIDGGMTMA